jgi:S1-C subfamily serine protease
VTSPFNGFEVAEEMGPSARGHAFALDEALASVVALQAQIPEDAFTARTLGTERIGNGVVIGQDGLVLTIGYLITEAETALLTTVNGRDVPAHVLGYDAVTGFGLVHALEPLGVPAMPLGTSRRITPGDSVILAGAGGRAHALQARLLARERFAGYWEYLLEDALFTTPAHPHWSGAALIGSQGELVGLGSLQVEQAGPDGTATPLNMCVPAELLPPILDDLARGQPAHAPRPWLGVFSQEVGNRIMVLDVAKGGPASRAELRRGDVILGVGGEPVADQADFYRKLWATGPAGVDVPLSLWRGGDVFDVTLRSIDRNTMMRKRRLN